MRVLFVFLISIVLLVTSGCAASKHRLKSESNLTEVRSSKRGSSDNSGKRNKTTKVVVVYSTASTQPRLTVDNLNGYDDGRNNRLKSTDSSGDVLPLRRSRSSKNAPQLVDPPSRITKRSASEGKHGIKGYSNDIASLVLDVTPIIGDAKGVSEFVIGSDLVTGDPLSPFERWSGLVPGSKKLRAIKKGVELGQAAAAARKAASKINRQRKIRRSR